MNIRQRAKEAGVTFAEYCRPIRNEHDQRLRATLLRSWEPEGCKRLLVAVLLQAVTDARFGKTGAQAWLEEENTADEIAVSEYICEVLGVDRELLLEREKAKWPTAPITRHETDEGRARIAIAVERV